MSNVYIVNEVEHERSLLQSSGGKTSQFFAVSLSITLLIVLFFTTIPLMVFDISNGGNCQREYVD